MKQKETLIKLYFLLVGSKELAGKKETEMGKQMASYEGLDHDYFQQRMSSLNEEDYVRIYRECVSDLQHMNQHLRIRFLAWMILIANSDGFMEETEWQLIYKLYHKELRVSLSDLMKEQKELLLLIKNKTQKVML